MERPKVAQMAVADISIGLLLYSQIRALEKSGFDVQALSAPGPFADRAAKTGIHTVSIPIKREPSFWSDFQCLFALVKLFREQKYAIVNSHTPKAGLLGPLAAKIARVPLVIHTVHGFMFHDQMPLRKRAFFWCVEKFTSTFSDLLFFQSEEDTHTARKKWICGSNKIRYIGNGINMRSFVTGNTNAQKIRELKMTLGISEDQLVIGTVGRLVYEKGFREFFELIDSLLKRHSHLQFVIIGPEETRDQKDAIQTEEINRLKASGRIHFLGMRNDLNEIYPLLDIFVLLSHREGLPRALLEACAMERACIATDIRGCREVIQDQSTGFLVPLFDAQKTLERVEQLIANRSLREQLGKSASLYVRTKFDEDFVNERIQSAYREALEKRKLC